LPIYLFIRKKVYKNSKEKEGQNNNDNNTLSNVSVPYNVNDTYVNNEIIKSKKKNNKNEKNEMKWKYKA